MITWIRKNFFSIVFGLVFLYPLWNSYWANLFQEKVFWFILSIVCLCLTQLSRFKKIKGLGMEAELWDETQNKAEALTTQLSSLVDLVIQGQVLNLNRMGMAFDSHIPRKTQWEKFQEIKRQYPSSEKSLEQFRLIILQWWGRHIDKEFFYFDCGNEESTRQALMQERTSLKLKKLELRNLDLASSFKTEGNLMIGIIEDNLEKLKTSNSFEKQKDGVQKTLQYLKAFVETGEFENEQWFSKLLEKDV